MMQETPNITGVDALLKQLPEEYHHWHLFGNVKHFRIGEELNPETFDYQYNGEIILTDTHERYKIRLTFQNVRGKFWYNIGSLISGFTVKDKILAGYENQSVVEITDFEQDWNIQIYCSHVHAELAEEESIC